MVDSMSVRLKNARFEKMPLNIRILWNAGTDCVSECVLKTLACRGLRVGPSKPKLGTQGSPNFAAQGCSRREFMTDSWSSGHNNFRDCPENGWG